MHFVRDRKPHVKKLDKILGIVVAVLGPPIPVFCFQAEGGIRDLTVTGFRRVLFRSSNIARSVPPMSDPSAILPGMLELVRVRAFAIIEELEVHFAPGFNVLTGETGAGKSILVEIGRASCRERV